MGKDLAAAYPAAKARFDEADAILGYSISQLCWEGPADQLTRTEHCQPALYVSSFAALAALESELGNKAPLKPSAGAGLSLGEYTALAAAGAVSFADGLKLVRLRGQAMQEAAQKTAGAMASVLGMELDALSAVCAESGAQVANLNSPGQIVISGTAESVAAASAKAKEKGAKRVIPLEVAGAFHSRLMEPAADKLRQALLSVGVQNAHYSVLSNVTGVYHADPESIRKRLVEQLTHSVNWIGCVETMAKSGIKTYFELGSGTVLKGLVKKIDPEAVVYSVGTPEQVKEVAGLWA